ncbi:MULTISPECIES: UDP-3-O-(3-hydroxymyristoyl)glucosamine N-acyltransferase [Duncaniella]|uniref:UDP-3-O-(3-hydroxymyristoyl)glucosamine N-acyltransferase n=1 Tax=Duncaniella TaxID=2518495 RepID=UPI000E969EBA|nr:MULTISPECIES: UDP-3-O-(3-hydroxymyristoyl)glucosamine N-acyltransferase [Duncaniella]MBJ2191658.1 UDP-3-O-(3-hydroxymyristoyl)glucosamine N-acyltransferase [Muribaculaceae bacterium]MCX4284180.1 UDP-3-O-(3-hydroxymyristoyl)glucosamine N-acyltransferase [Duncaniella dubosii]HBN63231.1 UDP-3-O-(3-hydroxymyristoyl)glucosamine N-acyltransferase [Porphyromonadaceae bacterium]
MELTASQLAAIVNGTVEGDENVKVSTFARIEEGHSGALSFLANPKYTHHIYSTDSSVVLVKKDFTPEHPVKATLIRVDDPYATVAHLLEMVTQMSKVEKAGIETPSFISEGVDVPEDAYVGAFAYIGKGVKLAPGVKIYPQVYIGDGCEVGEGSVLYAGVKIYAGCKVGKRCIIHSGAVIGADGFGFAPIDGGYEKIPQTGNVEIEDDVEIGANTTIDRAMMGATRIGRGVKLDNLIQIAHNCSVGEHTVMAAQAGVAGSAKIGAHCMVGGQVGFVGHISIADGTQIGAQSGVSKPTKPGDRVMGSPAVDMGEYARGLVYAKKLGSLYERVKELEKKIK